MPNVIKPKRSAVAGNIPTTSQIGQYEIAMNTADKKIFTSNGTNIIQIAAGDLSGLGDVQITSPSNGQGLSYNSTTGKWINSNAGTGDVQGPASSVDNSVVRFDGTTGKLIQGSPVTISDTGAISGAESISNIDFAQFDTTVAVTEAVGKLQWDDGNGTLQFGLKGGNVNLQVGQEMVARVYNDSGVALTDGQVVYISGSQGNRIAVKLAKADSEATSAGTLGIVTEPIAIGAEGFITMMGVVNKLNTSGLTAGALIYLSASTAGAYTTTRPTAPNHTVILGYVERVSTTVGSIYVKVDNGYELDELHNVVITTPSNGQTLIYDAVAGVWENSTLTAGTGVSVTNGAGTITIANTGVTSITGTANQISASASTGGVTLSLPATINVNTSGSAATLTTGRTIGMTGDVTWTSGSFNGSANVTGTATLASVGTAGTYTKVTTDAKGRVTSGTTLSASDIPEITLEKVPDAWVKRSVKAATTANIALSGTQTIDGVALVAGDRVLVKDQTAAAENGIYVVSATVWSRSADADTISELAGACVNVDSGTTNGGMRFDTDLKTTDTLGTTAVSFYRVLDFLDLATANTANKVVLRDGSGNFSAGTITAALSGNASTATTLQTARTINGTSFNGSANITIDQLYRIDDRSIAPADITTGYMKFGFTSWSNNSTAPYADFLHLRSYTDASGGNDNLVMFRKDAIGMRIYQQAYGSATAYSTYKDVAFTDQLPTVNAGTFSVSIGTAGATNTTVTWGTSSGFNANTATNYTYDLKIGPALTNLASTMTGATTGFIKKTGADTYSLDTNTYLTSYTETDTLQSVTSRGNTTTTTIQHGGLVMSAGTNVDQVYTVTDSLTLTTAWQDTSVNAAELATGSYVVQLLVDDYAVGGGHYSTYYTGMMSWYGADTNETSSDEIVLHRAGHASNAGKIYLRVLRTASADVADLKLQISGTTTNTGASNYQFKFRRLI